MREFEKSAYSHNVLIQLIRDMAILLKPEMVLCWNVFDKCFR